MKKIVCISLFFLSLLSVSCEKGEKEVKVEEPKIVEPELLPDTSYSSVENVDYQIEIMDSVRSGKLSSRLSEYTDTITHFTFRNGPYRRADFGGKVKGRPTKIVVDWTFETGPGKPSTLGGNWMGGTGWSGQPLYVQWPDSVYQKMKKAPGVTAEMDSVEIIASSLCGEIYFINPKTGKETRQHLDGGAVLKGTMSLDPSFNGNLYSGQGVSFVGGTLGHQAFNLFTMERTYYWGPDRKAGRSWHAYDSSPICVGGFLFWPGENGTLYKYTREKDSLIMHSTFKYKVKGMAPGMEGSMSVYSNYGYISDNNGNIICLNLNNLKPVWWYDNLDDTDCSPVIDFENGVPYIYVGCEVDKRGSEATARLAKLNALTGQEVWVHEQMCRKRMLGGGKTMDAGYLSTPLLGEGNCKDLIFSNPVLFGSEGGWVIAIDKKTGKEVYHTKLNHYAWSSMVGFTNEKGEMYIFLGDCGGDVHLIEAKTGKILYTEHVGNNFEGSPVVFGNSVVIGTRGYNIFKMSIQ